MKSLSKFLRDQEHFIMLTLEHRLLGLARFLLMFPIQLPDLAVPMHAHLYMFLHLLSLVALYACMEFFLLLSLSFGMYVYIYTNKLYTLISPMNLFLQKRTPTLSYPQNRFQIEKYLRRCKGHSLQRSSRRTGSQH